MAAILSEVDHIFRAAAGAMVAVHEAMVAAREAMAAVRTGATARAMPDQAGAMGRGQVITTRVCRAIQAGRGFGIRLTHRIPDALMATEPLLIIP